jgi:hypothetical protein
MTAALRLQVRETETLFQFPRHHAACNELTHPLLPPDLFEPLASCLISLGPHLVSLPGTEAPVPSLTGPQKRDSRPMLWRHSRIRHWRRWSLSRRHDGGGAEARRSTHAPTNDRSYSVSCLLYALFHCCRKGPTMARPCSRTAVSPT